MSCKFQRINCSMFNLMLYAHGYAIDASGVGVWGLSKTETLHRATSKASLFFCLFATLCSKFSISFAIEEHASNSGWPKYTQDPTRPRAADRGRKRMHETRRMGQSEQHPANVGWKIACVLLLRFAVRMCSFDWGSLYTGVLGKKRCSKTAVASTAVEKDKHEQKTCLSFLFLVLSRYKHQYFFAVMLLLNSKLQ